MPTNLSPLPTNVYLYIPLPLPPSPGVVVPVHECGGPEVVPVLRECAHSRGHLSSVPLRWTRLSILGPRVLNFVLVLNNERDHLHKYTRLRERFDHENKLNIIEENNPTHEYLHSLTVYRIFFVSILFIIIVF